MHSDIHIFAACTDRKRLPVPNRLRLRSVSRNDTSNLAKAWWLRLENNQTEAVVAEHLYAGDHWSTVRKLPAIVQQQGLTSQSWVISAGYGLVSVTSEIRPYSATFAASYPDSVTNRVTKVVSRKVVLQSWWKEICAMKSASAIKARSISHLARRTPDSTFIIIASPDYLLALEQDLIAEHPGPYRAFNRAHAVCSGRSVGIAACARRIYDSKKKVGFACRCFAAATQEDRCQESVA